MKCRCTGEHHCNGCSAAEQGAVETVGLMASHPFWDWVRLQPLRRREELLGLLLAVKVELTIQEML